MSKVIEKIVLVYVGETNEVLKYIVCVFEPNGVGIEMNL